MDLEKDLRRKLLEWNWDIKKFVVDAFGAEPTWQQMELIDNIIGRKGNAFAIRSGHGTGKSAVLSWILIWFLVTRPQCKIVATAPTKRQLRDILWAEVSYWVSKAIEPIRQILDIKAERIVIRGREDWWARAVSINVQATPEEQAESLAGYHAKYFMALIDEASGLPEPVFTPIESYLTQESNYVIMTGNPTRTSGYFYNVFNDEIFGADWIKLHWNSEKSPIVNPDWCERMKRKYGEDSDTYRIRVKGEFPRTAQQQLIPMEWLRRNVIQKDCIVITKPIVWGFDVAHQGGDESSLVKRTNSVVFSVSGKEGLDTMENTDWILEEYFKTSDKEKPEYIFVDVTGGYGIGVSEALKRRLGKIIVDVNYSWSAFNSNDYVALRDELWWRLRTAFEYNRLNIIDDERLIRQLSSIKYDETGSGKVKVESKKQMRARGLGSPDRGDALMQTFFYDNIGYQTGVGTVRRNKRYLRRRRGWMAA